MTEMKQDNLVSSSQHEGQPQQVVYIDEMHQHQQQIPQEQMMNAAYYSNMFVPIMSPPAQAAPTSAGIYSITSGSYPAAYISTSHHHHHHLLPPQQTTFYTTASPTVIPAPAVAVSPIPMPMEAAQIIDELAMNNGPGPPIATAEEERGPRGANVFVFHLPGELTNWDLYLLFRKYGTILSVRIMVNMQTGMSRGYGFISYASPQDAENAIQNMDGFKLGKKRLKVQLKKDSPEHDDDENKAHDMDNIDDFHEEEEEDETNGYN